MKAIGYILILLLYMAGTNAAAQSISKNKLSSKSQKKISLKNKVLDSLIQIGASENKFIRVYNDLSWLYLNGDGSFLEAEKYNILSDSLAFLIRDTSLMAEALTIKGRIFNRRGFFASALETHKKAFEFKAALRDTGRMSYSMNLIGGVFRTQGKYEEALSFYMRGLILKDAINVGHRSYLSFKAISDCHLNLGDYQKARLYANKTLPLVKEGSRRFGKSCLMIAEIDLLENKIDAALRNARKAEKCLIENGTSLEVAQAQIILAKVLMTHNLVNEAKQVIESAYSLSIKDDHPILIIESLEILKSILIKNNDYKKALKLTQEIQIAQDSFYNREELTKSQDFETLYRVKEREKEIAILQAEKDKNQKDIAIKEKEKTRISAVLAIVSLFLIAFIWFTNYKRKMNQKISEKDQKIHDQKIKEMEQVQKNIRLHSMIEGQEKERKRISQDIHDSLGGLLASAKTYLTSKEGHDPNIEKIIDRSCEEIREITNNLMPVSLNVVGLSGAIEDLASRAEIHGLNCTLELHSVNLPNAVLSLQIYRIIQELINNVIKHASASSLLIQMIQSEESIHIVIEDDGIGFDHNGESIGMGLKNIRSRIELLEGKVEFESSINTGTTVTIEIPLTQKQYS